MWTGNKLEWGEVMTYKEAYMNCKSKEEFRAMVSRDVSYAILFSKDRLKNIEDAVNEVCQVHPDWSDMRWSND